MLKTAILKIGTAVLLTILVLCLLNRMYVQYQTINSLMQETDDLKATNGALVREVEDLKEKFNRTSALVDLKATNGALVREVENLKEKFNRTSASVDLKATNGDLIKYIVKQLVQKSESLTATYMGDIKKFLDSNETVKKSESFRLKGLFWHISLERSIGEYEGQLGVYLCNDITEFFGFRYRDWSVNVTFDLMLMDHNTKQDLGRTIYNSRKFSNVFEKNSKHNCYGSPMFYRIESLYRGFVKEGALDVVVQVKKLELNLID